MLFRSLTVSAAFTSQSISHRVLRGNDVSYGVYIYHGPILNVLLVLGIRSAVGMTIFFAATIAAACLSWLLVERPALKLKRYSIRASVVPVY